MAPSPAAGKSRRKCDFVDPSKYDLALGDGEERAHRNDLIVFDRWAPADPPAGRYLLRPSDRIPWLRPAGAAARAWDASEETQPR